MKEKILDYIDNHGPSSGTALSKIFNVSRQAVNKHLKTLIEKGEIRKEGTTRGALYTNAGQSEQERKITAFKKKYRLSGAEEHSVFEQFESALNLRKNVRKNVYEIIRYAFTEIMNNAIEHSHSQYCDVEGILQPYRCRFAIRDYGIGVFFSIYQTFNLEDENNAVLELLKGKKTTMEKRHSGEGIFFTSKSGDHVSFRSHKVKISFENVIGDVFLETLKFQKGTEVIFEISRRSRKLITEIFNKYAPEKYDYKFEKTRVCVRLMQKELVSRSEAKRLLSGLDRFKEVVLDFQSVTMLGQAFADEVFRVFRKQYPGTIIKIENLSSSLKPILRHVVDNQYNHELTTS